MSNKDGNKNFILLVKEFSKGNGWWLKWVLPIIVITPFFIYFTLTTKSSIGILNSSDAGLFMSFYGGIISGSFTLLGVILTIKNESKKHKIDYQQRNKLKKEEQKIIYKPFAIISLQDNKIEKESDDVVNFFLLLKNCGRGELYLNSIKASDNKNNIINCYINRKQNDNRLLLLAGEEVIFKCSYKFISKEDISNIEYLLLIFSVRYLDLFLDENDEIEDKISKNYILHYNHGIIEESLELELL